MVCELSDLVCCSDNHVSVMTPTNSKLVSHISKYPSSRSVHILILKISQYVATAQKLIARNWEKSKDARNVKDLE